MRDVEELALDELDGHEPPRRAHRGGRRGDEERRLAEGQVGDEGGDAVAEEFRVAQPSRDPVPLGGDDVQGGPATAGGRPVHDVVLDEGEEVEQLEGRRDAHEVGVGAGRTAGDGPAPVGQHRPQPLAVVACPLGQLADEVDPQGTGVRTSRVVGGVVGGGGHQCVGELAERAVEHDVRLGERAAHRGREALGAEVERGHVGTHRLNRLIPLPVGLDSTRSCGAPEPRQVGGGPPHNLRQSLSHRTAPRPPPA